MNVTYDCDVTGPDCSSLCTNCSQACKTGCTHFKFDAKKFEQLQIVVRRNCIQDGGHIAVWDTELLEHRKKGQI